MTRQTAEINTIDASQHEINFGFDSTFRNTASVRFIDMAADGSVSAGKGTNDVSESFVADVENMRNAVRSIPSDESGINLAKINTFRQKMGAPKKAILYLGNESYQRALALLNDPPSESEGYYEGMTDVALVRRSPDLELINGTEVTEAFAIHEIAHSSATINPVLAIRKARQGIFHTSSTTEFMRSRMGFYVRDAQSNRSGATLEEGYADLERGLYVREANLVAQFTSGASNYGQLMDSPIPSHYLYKHGDPKEPTLTFSHSTVPATILEILIEHDQELLYTLRASRSDITELGNVACRMEDLMPGLYNRMLKAVDPFAATTILTDVLKRFKPRKS